MSTAAELHDFIRSRRSIRRFSDAPIPADTVRRILETAIHAPSAHNRQPWRFAVITEAAAKSRLANAMAVEFARDLEADGVPAEEREGLVERSRGRITSAPLVIVLCMDMAHMDRYADEKRAQAERTMAIQSAANAGATLLLAAHAEGLGGVWVCAPLFAPGAVTQALDLPISWEPQALLLVGEPVGQPRERPQGGIGEVAVFR